jgi:hypothetical protein
MNNEEGPRVFKENDNVNSANYWERRKKYERVINKKNAAWQMEKAEHMKILVRQKEAKIIWEAIRTIVKKRYFKNDVKLCDLLK